MKIPQTRTTIILPKIDREYGDCPFNHRIKTLFKTIYVIEVGPKSRRHLRDSTEIIAFYFKREFGYDFVQYGAVNDDAKIYLFAEFNSNEFIGACCFRTRETKHSDDSIREREWLEWIWIHPFYRNDGIFTSFLPIITKNHPNFLLAFPLSKTMQHISDKFGLHKE